METSDKIIYTSSGLNMKKHTYNLLTAVLMAILFVPMACVDLAFDEPPAGGEDPNLPVNITIAELKDRHVLEQYEEITDDITFSGLVVSDDEEGNFFKQLVIQDSTGGIEMRIEMTDLHNVYPVGRKVYVKAKGLWLGDYNGLIQLGAGVGVDDDGDPELIRIPESLVDQYIVTATYGNTVSPKTLTIDQLDQSDVSTLVRFEGVQFVAGDAGQTYADVVLQQTLNRDVEDCSRRQLILRTSGFASFAGDSTPTQNGTLVGVLSIFGDVYQLTIRDLDDVDMEGDRCASSDFAIDAVRDLFTGGPTTAPGGTIKGVVISDYTSKSVQSKNLYIQDASGGIVLRFTADHSFPKGAELQVDISGANIDEFRGLLQIDGLALNTASIIGNPGDVIPREATVLEVLTNAEAWESTLVKINNVTLDNAEGSTYAGNVTVSDASGTMLLFTLNQATFAQTSLPTGEVSITALLSEFDAPQLIMRNAADVTGGGTGGDEEYDINEIRQLFASGSTSAPGGTIQGRVISDYTSQSVTGRNLYIQDSTGGIVVRFAQNHTFALGSEIRIAIGGGVLSEFNGLLQIDGIVNSSGTVLSNPGDVTPRVVTVSEVLSNLESWESTLVRINNVTLTGNTIYSGSVTVSDGTGTIVMFTRSQALFAQDAIPAGQVDIVGIVSQFNDPQIIIRNTADVKQ